MSVIICFVIAFSVALLCLLFCLVRGGSEAGWVAWLWGAVFLKGRKEGEEEDTMLKGRGMIPGCMLLVLGSWFVCDDMSWKPAIMA